MRRVADTDLLEQTTAVPAIFSSALRIARLPLSLSLSLSRLKAHFRLPASYKPDGRELPTERGAIAPNDFSAPFLAYGQRDISGVKRVISYSTNLRPLSSSQH